MKITAIHFKQSPNLGAFMVQQLSVHPPAPPVKKKIALEIWNEMPPEIKNKTLAAFAHMLADHYDAVQFYAAVLLKGAGRN